MSYQETAAGDIMFVYTVEHMKIQDPEVRSSKYSADKGCSSNPVTPTLTSLLKRMTQHILIRNQCRPAKCPNVTIIELPESVTFLRTDSLPARRSREGPVQDPRGRVHPQPCHWHSSNGWGQTQLPTVQFECFAARFLKLGMICYLEWWIQTQTADSVLSCDEMYDVILMLCVILVAAFAGSIFTFQI